MSNQELEIFIHGQGTKPKVVVANSGDHLRDVLIRSEFLKDSQDDAFVFVGEWTQALTEPDEIENGIDEHAPVDVSLTLEVLEIKRHHHIHCHRCRHIGVEVNFGGKTKHRKFSPAATIEVVAHWARKKFHLDAAVAHEYVLQLCGTTNRPRPDKHLGELVEAEKCGLCFDLVKEITPQG